MAAKILSGRDLSAEIRGEVASGVAEMQEKHGVTPGLAVVLVGGDPASAVYVANKQKACQQAGVPAGRSVQRFRSPAWHGGRR